MCIRDSGNGVDFVKDIKTTYPYIEIVLLTAYGNIPDGVKAIKYGAFDYLVKGDDNEKIIPVLSQLGTIIAGRKDNIPKERPGGFTYIVGNSKSTKDAIALAEKVAATDTAVLLTGETGTGKMCIRDSHITELREIAKLTFVK